MGYALANSGTDIESTIKRAIDGSITDADKADLFRLVQGIGDGSVTIGESADGATILTGSGNLLFHGVSPEALTAAIQKSFPPRLHTLEPPPADFVGRKEELDELLKAVQTGGVTISGLRGMGGVGKTALALVLADKLAPDYPDAQIFLDLKGASDKPLSTADALGHVVQAYHPESKLPEDETQLRELYLSVLNGQKVLLLMDNARDAAQASPLIPPPGCLMLVTSRASFHLPGLHPLNLDTLPPEDAQALLIKSAPRIGEDAEALAKMCGFLPLALRLAGGALATRTTLKVPDYIAQLKDVKQRLARLDKYQDQTDQVLGVDASLALSENLLDDAHREAWHKLSVFPATFDQPAAAAVWKIKPDRAGDVLGDLVAQHVLLWDDKTDRYLLHDLIRAYTVGRISDEHNYQSQFRHAEHFLKVLAAADDLYLRGGEHVVAGLGLFDLERMNIETGQQWSAEHAERDDPAAHLCNKYPDAGIYCLGLRHHARKERIPWLQAGEAAARRLGERHSQEMHLGNLGSAYGDFGEMRKAIEYLEQALIISREISDPRGKGQILGNLGNAYAALGETRKAIGYYEQRIKIAREVDDRRGEGNVLGNLGNAYAELGETHKGIGYHEQALIISRELGDRRGEGQDLGNLGNAYAALGETRKAIGYYEQRIKIAREVGDRRGEGNVLGNLGNAYAALGETGKAMGNYEQHLKIAREIGDRRGEGSALSNLGIAYDALGEKAKAVEQFESALRIFEAIEDTHAEIVRRQLDKLRQQA